MRPISVQALQPSDRCVQHQGLCAQALRAGLLPPWQPEQGAEHDSRLARHSRAT